MRVEHDLETAGRYGHPLVQSHALLGQSGLEQRSELMLGGVEYAGAGFGGSHFLKGLAYEVQSFLDIRFTVGHEARPQIVEEGRVRRGR